MPRKPKREADLDPVKEMAMPNNSTGNNPLDGKKDDQNVWVENLKTGDSIYRSDRSGDAFPMAGKGQAGSVISVPVKVAKEAFFRRSVSRGGMRLLSDEEAASVEEGLTFVDDSQVEINRTMEGLEKGASESGSRYKNKNLSDDGSEGRSIPAREVWDRKPAEPAGTVRRSTASDSSDTAAADIPSTPVALDDIPDGPAPAVVTETVREGEWKSDTGE